MKKLCLLLLILLIPALAECSTLYRIRFGYYPEKIRTVFDFDGGFTYESKEDKNKIELLFKGVEASPDIQSYVELNDLVIRYLQIEKEGKFLKVTIPLSEPIDYNIFYLNDPPRLIIDFDREFLNVISGGLIADGLEFLKVKKGTPKGNILATVLEANLTKIEIVPALANKYKPSALQSILGFITRWGQKEPERKHFFLERVSSIAQDYDALAAINGTFFSYTGSPLGALIIDGELISYSIYDRTAFFLDEQNHPYIDNVFIRSYFKFDHKKTRYEISGINQARSSQDMILYTPAWGKTTGTNDQGLEIVVENSKVQSINLANSKIPKDGYVLSISGPGVETLSANAKIGQSIETHLKVIPYATAPDGVVHLISGGPRLLKEGRVYISKHEEKFKPDVAKKRAGRTAIGITKAGKVLLVTVQAPSKRTKNNIKESLGATLEELSNLMLSLGAQDAVNLDGGSSSTMVIKGKTVCGSTRKVSNAIILRKK